MADIERTGFFNAKLVDGKYDREYESEDFSRYFALFFGDGVFINPADQLKVKAKSGLTVTLTKGHAFLMGHYYELLEDIDIPISPSSANQRVNIVLTLSMTNRTITRSVVANSSSGSGYPSIPAPQRNDTTRQIILATIPIPAGTATITDSMITDLRPNETYCGFVKGAIESIETGDLFAQFTDAFNQWFENIKGKLGEDPAGNLQNQIDEMAVIRSGTSEPSNSLGKDGDIYVKIVN